MYVRDLRTTLCNLKLRYIGSVCIHIYVHNYVHIMCKWVWGSVTICDNLSSDKLDLQIN